MRKKKRACEIDRYIERGFCRVMLLEALRERFKRGTAASKLALILKQKPDGSTKRRIVIDMRRSLGNARAKVGERDCAAKSTGHSAELAGHVSTRTGELDDESEKQVAPQGSRADLTLSPRWGSAIYAG